MSETNGNPIGNGEGGPPAGGPPLVDWIAQTIHAGILTGEYPLGSRLPQETLAKRFGVSRTPIREALRMLEAANLVQISPNTGAVVQGPTARSIREAYLVRAELEGLAAELAVPKMTPTALHELRAAEQEFRSAVRELARLDADVETATTFADGAWVHANDSFHEVILKASDNERLHRTIAELHVAFPRNLTWQALSARPSLLSDNVEEHQRILAAIERQEPGAARMHMTYHVLRAGELVAGWFEQLQPADR
jgi:DNA-binding GntR family transcriptional regulator